MEPLFYVTLPNDFEEKCSESSGGLFTDITDPYKEAALRLTIGKDYPVMEVSEDDQLIIVDDTGHLYKLQSRMVKFSHGTG